MSETALLLNTKLVDFADRKTGEAVNGFQVMLGRPCRDARYEGYGIYIYKFYDFSGPEAFRRGQEFVKQANGLYLKTCVIECDELTVKGGLKRLIPLSVSHAG